jgi:hypothetical protein
MKKLALAIAIISLGAVAVITAAIAKSGDHGGGNAFSARLTGYEEIVPGATPSAEGGAVSTRGHGTFRARLRSSTELEYRLTYRDLEGALTPGTGPSGQSHIHFGQRHTIGGVSAFLCGGGTKPPCPTTNPGSVEGVIRPSDVIGPAGQGIAANEFGELIRAMRNGATYVNLHTTTWPSGEIRGQVKGGAGPFKIIVFKGKGGRGKDD